MALRPRGLYRRCTRLWSGTFVCFVLWTDCAWAVPPTLYSQPAYESPVRGDPDDLVMLAGYGFAATDTVVYQSLGDTTQPLPTPRGIPAVSTAIAGVAPVVSVQDVPDSLTIKLPSVMQTDLSYALWVMNKDGEWSSGVKINDARPLWITPDTVYVTASVASLPRYLKVVGRNLQPAPGATTQVRLTGPTVVTLAAANDNNPATAIERYVAKVTLPNLLPAGSYTVEASRDGISWIPVNDQTLIVFPDPRSPAATFDVKAYGGCLPDDGVDDTPCIAAAIAAAKSNGGGTVTFGPGVWNMGYTGALSTAGPVTFDGVLVPVGVNLVGAGAGRTIVQRDVSWNRATPNFALQGNNTVECITFRDANVYQASSSAAPILRLGVAWYFAQLYNPTDPSYVSGVTITRNEFDKPYMAIADDGLPVDHLLVTYNVFGAFAIPIVVGGDANNVSQPFRIDDSIFAFNIFDPGSYTNPAIVQGVMATGLGAGHRLDFSGNTADGTSTRYLYDPVNDPRGWRAAHFWSDRGNNEEVLVSQNVATCTGDKAGDGEAITTDGSTFTDGLAAAQPVIAAAANAVTIPGPLLLQQSGKTLPGNYFSAHWVQIAEGPGKGQVRRIVSYPLDPSGQPVTPVTFTVTPAWDVIPQAGSKLVVSREYWQFYIVDNFVDQRQPLCTKGNANKPSGGTIGFYTQTADSAIEGNQQYDTSGVRLGIGYSAQDSATNTAPGVNLYSFVEVRANTVDGEYDWSSDCSWAGIQVIDGAAPTPGYPPPVEGYGISIAHNTITQADGLHGGAIALTRGWYAGPSPSTWNMADNTLVFGNVISNVSGPPPYTVTGPLPYTSSPYKQCPKDQPQRIGINGLDATIWHTVFSANSCNNVARSLVDGGTASQRVCPSPAGNSCECSAYIQGTYGESDVQSVVPVAYSATQTAGDLNVVVVGWGDSTSNVTAVTDSAGNTYRLAIGPTRSPGSASQSIYYAANIVAAASNAVTVTFDTAVQSPDIRIAEYSGLDMANPFDAATGAASGSTSPSGWITTRNANDLLVVGDFTGAAGVGAVPRYTQRVGSDAGNILEDRTVSTTGAYGVTATIAGARVMQMVAFRLAGGGNTNTQALSAPGNLSAVASGRQVNLVWNGSTDNIGVKGYLVERCAGVGCADFAQIAQVSGTNYTDTESLSPAYSYTWRVRATDVANLQSDYSNTASATTESY